MMFWKNKTEAATSAPAPQLDKAFDLRLVPPCPCCAAQGVGLVESVNACCRAYLASFNPY